MPFALLMFFASGWQLRAASGLQALVQTLSRNSGILIRRTMENLSKGIEWDPFPCLGMLGIPCIRL